MNNREKVICIAVDSRGMLLIKNKLLHNQVSLIISEDVLNQSMCGVSSERDLVEGKEIS